METRFMNTENSKTNESHNFVLNLSQTLDLILEERLRSSKLVNLRQH